MAKRRSQNTIADVKAMLRGQPVEWKEPLKVDEKAAPPPHRKPSPEVEALQDALAKQEVTQTPELDKAAKQADSPLTVEERGKATIIPKAPVSSPVGSKREQDKKG